MCYVFILCNYTFVYYSFRRNSVIDQQFDDINNDAGDDASLSNSSETDAELLDYGGNNSYQHRSISGSNYIPTPTHSELYFFGIIRLPHEAVRRILRDYAPPHEYHRLHPIEKAAYLYFFSLYRRHYLPVENFHKRFAHEYSKYMLCEGATPEHALLQVGDSIC
jgi:hypothetical protein